MRVGSKSKASKRQEGNPCAYCQRPMICDDPELKPSRDHVLPRKYLRQMRVVERSAASRIIWCCLFCNHVRDSLTTSEWLAFRIRFPNWFRMPLRAAIHQRQAFQMGKVRAYRYRAVVRPAAAGGEPFAIWCEIVPAPPGAV